jgi:hypothetical protein
MGLFYFGKRGGPAVRCAVCRWAGAVRCGSRLLATRVACTGVSHGMQRCNWSPIDRFSFAATHLLPVYPAVGAADDTMQRILQCLASLGYQASFRLVNAGSFGTAQHRRRVIIFAARHGLPMPDWPEPTHVFEGAGGYREGLGGRPPTCSMHVRRAGG